MKPTKAQLDSAALADLLADAAFAERQANEGPFYPERGITPESLLAYAAECWAKAASCRDGGAHAAILAS